MKILIVEDDELIANIVKENLKLEGFETLLCGNGLDALEINSRMEFDMIILDIMLPGLDGFHVCRQLQGKGIPIIMLTAKNDISDRLAGLEAGADDYIIKPFDSRELIARIRTIFRRLEKANLKIQNTDETNKAELSIEINEETRRVYVNNSLVELTHTEFDLLLLLYKNKGKVFTRSALMDTVWGYDFLGDSRTVDIHIQRIRKKLGNNSDCVETVFGVGYRFKEINK